MNMQDLVNAISDSHRTARQRYHVTLGHLTDVVLAMPSYGRVSIDGKTGLCGEHSYRGYYDDLAFDTCSCPTPKDDAVAMLKRAVSDTYTGYKGGDYTYNRNTPLWVASYGCCGSAVTGIATDDGDVVLTLTNVE